MLCHTKREDEVNRVKRYIAAEYVSMGSFLLVSAHHHLWRATVMNKAGLTPKELELLHKKMDELKGIQHLLSKVAHRLRQSGSCI
jgi:hypothetical protein